MTRQQQKAARAITSYNKRVDAEHQNIIAQILVLRPGWSRAALEAVGKSSSIDRESPGLYDIRDAILAYEKVEARFGGAS